MQLGFAFSIFWGQHLDKQYPCTSVAFHAPVTSTEGDDLQGLLLLFSLLVEVRVA